MGESRVRCFPLLSSCQHEESQEGSLTRIIRVLVKYRTNSPAEIGNY